MQPIPFTSDYLLNAQPALTADGRAGVFFFDEVSNGSFTWVSIAGRYGVARMAISVAAASVSNWLGCADVGDRLFRIRLINDIIKV